jgi:hypothetical protein
MNKKTIFYVGVYAVAAYGAYYMFFSKSAYVRTIKKTNNYSGTAKDLKDLVGKNFLKPWARAAKNNVPTFEFEGKTYNTKGGKIVR